MDYVGVQHDYSHTNISKFPYNGSFPFKYGLRNLKWVSFFSLLFNVSLAISSD